MLARTRPGARVVSVRYPSSYHKLFPIAKSLVRSHLEYVNSVWYRKRKTDVDKLERVQKRATKLIPELAKNHMMNG